MFSFKIGKVSLQLPKLKLKSHWRFSPPILPSAAEPHAGGVDSLVPRVQHRTSPRGPHWVRLTIPALLPREQAARGWCGRACGRRGQRGRTTPRPRDSGSSLAGSHSSQGGWSPTGFYWESKFEDPGLRWSPQPPCKPIKGYSKPFRSSAPSQEGSSGRDGAPHPALSGALRRAEGGSFRRAPAPAGCWDGSRGSDAGRRAAGHSRGCTPRCADPEAAPRGAEPGATQVCGFRGHPHVCEHRCAPTGADGRNALRCARTGERVPHSRTPRPRHAASYTRFAARKPQTQPASRLSNSPPPRTWSNRTPCGAESTRCSCCGCASESLPGCSTWQSGPTARPFRNAESLGPCRHQRSREERSARLSLLGPGHSRAPARRPEQGGPRRGGGGGARPPMSGRNACHSRGPPSADTVRQPECAPAQRAGVHWLPKVPFRTR